MEGSHFEIVDVISNKIDEGTFLPDLNMENMKPIHKPGAVDLREYGYKSIDEYYQKNSGIDALRNFDEMGEFEMIQAFTNLITDRSLFEITKFVENTLATRYYPILTKIKNDVPIHEWNDLSITEKIDLLLLKSGNIEPKYIHGFVNDEQLGQSNYWVMTEEVKQELTNQIKTIFEESKDGFLNEDKVNTLIDDYYKNTQAIKEINSEEVKTVVIDLFNKTIEQEMINVNQKINSTLEKQMELFLKQFSNKIQLVMNEKLSNL